MVVATVRPRATSSRSRKPTVADQTLTVASLFSGMGGFLGGAAAAGFNPVWANDSDPDCAATITHRFPETRVIEKPIEELSVEGDGLEPVDLLLAGFPCQSFSVGGRREGFDDRRGQAVFGLFRLLREWGDDRPSVLMLENVPNFRRGDEGRWFATIAKEIKRAGFWFRESTHAQVINTARLTGVPQDRSRLFMVACSTREFKMNGYRFPEQNATIESLERFVDRTRKTNNGYMKEDGRFTAMILNEMSATGNPHGVYQIRRHYARGRNDGLCPTLTANMGVGGHNVPFIIDEWGVRKLTIDECARLQGFNQPETLFPADVPDGARYRMIGNAVTHSVASSLALQAHVLLSKQRGQKLAA